MVWLACLALLPYGNAQAETAVLPYWQAPFPAFYNQSGQFLQAMHRAEKSEPLAESISGLTLPHHLLAIDLMAKGWALARQQKYDRIILLSPDHFRRGATPFSLPERDFSTCLGPVKLDRAALAQLLGNPLVSKSGLFSHEHGIQAHLPFVAHYFPETPVVPLALDISSKPEEWDALAESLRPLLTPRTLIVQSTDFSHYLTLLEADQHDAETLRVINSGQPELVKNLSQPAHLDSRAAQYLQMKLQREIYQAHVTVTDQANSCRYLRPGETPPLRTTSYIVQIYSPTSASAASGPE